MREAATQEAEAAARMLIANANPVMQATGHIEVGFALLGMQRWADAAAASNTALKLLRSAPGGAIAAQRPAGAAGRVQPAHRRARQGRANCSRRWPNACAPRPVPIRGVQALFTLEAMARAARAVGDWELAGRMARQMLEHDPAYAGSHYALGLVAEHDGDGATAQSRVRACAEVLGAKRIRICRSLPKFASER